MTNRIAFAMALGAAAGAGCAGNESLQSSLDENGSTWVRTQTMVTLARSVPRLSAAARDYIYLAPVEANNAGVRRHYLWVGIGTTVDRVWGRAVSDNAVSVVLLLDGMPVALPLSSWETEWGGSLYGTPAPVHRVQRTRVTLDQLDRIANAESIEVRIVTDQGTVARYELWDGAWWKWNAFVAEVASPSVRQRGFATD
jgi:hypothetical protein